MAALIEVKDKYVPCDDAAIDYGPSSANFSEVVGAAPTYYITTAIAYTNGYPHMGHAYEFLSTDVLARFHRILGYIPLQSSNPNLPDLTLTLTFTSTPTLNIPGETRFSVQAATSMAKRWRHLPQRLAAPRSRTATSTSIHSRH